MKELVEAMVKALVDNPDQVRVRAIEGEHITVFELRVHPSDLGKVIGRQGRTVTAIRTILGAASVKVQVSEREKAEAEVRKLASSLEAKIRRLVEANVVMNVGSKPSGLGFRCSLAHKLHFPFPDCDNFWSWIGTESSLSRVSCQLLINARVEYRLRN